jgi:hypothetical protein
MCNYYNHYSRRRCEACATIRKKMTLTKVTVNLPNDLQVTDEDEYGRSISDTLTTLLLF